MKTIPIVNFFLFFLVCSCHTSQIEKAEGGEAFCEGDFGQNSPQIENTEGLHVDNSKAPISDCLLKIDIFHDTMPHKIPVFSSTGTIVDTFFCHHDSVLVRRNIQNFARFFHPEYGFIYFDVDSVDKAYGKIYFGRKKYYVLQNDSIIQTIRWNDFLKTVLIEPQTDYRLFTSPWQKSPILFPERKEMIVYTCDSVWKDWIHVETDTVCISPRSRLFLQGWLMWKVEDSLIVDIYLDC